MKRLEHLGLDISPPNIGKESRVSVRKKKEITKEKEKNFIKSTVMMKIFLFFFFFVNRKTEEKLNAEHT